MLIAHLKRALVCQNNSFTMQSQKNESPAQTKNELIIVQGDDNILIDARLLHQKLESGYQFTDWIKSRINEFGFKENEDFFASKNSEAVFKGGGHNKLNYFLTMDMAKELAMLERNEIGRSIRRYFIKAEKEARARQLPATFTFASDLKVIDLNGRKLVPYREFLVSIGHAPGGGAYARKKRYPNHFITFNGLDHVSTDLAGIIGLNWLLIKKRKEVKAMQPLLPIEFGSPLQLKGGRA